MKPFFALLLLLVASSALAVPDSTFNQTSPDGPGVVWTEPPAPPTLSDDWCYNPYENAETQCSDWEYKIYDCDGVLAASGAIAEYPSGVYDEEMFANYANAVANQQLESCMAESQCVPADEDGNVEEGMVACEQTLSDVRDALTNTDGLQTSPAPDSSISRSAAAFSTLTQQTTNKFNAADLPGKAADKFPFGYYELLSSPQLSGTACELNSTGAGVAGLWRYCGSQYDTFLGGAIKTMMSGLVWVSFALGVNARWAAAVT